MDPTGVLVLRVWREPEPTGELRARITTRLDVVDSSESSETFVVANSVDTMCDSVRQFLLTFAERARGRA
jgi:hypothetical protein